MCIYTCENVGGKARPEKMKSEIHLGIRHRMDTSSASSHSTSTGSTPFPAQNNSRCVTDCTRAATSLVIKINSSPDNIITEHQNLPIRTQDWKLPHGKVEWRIVFIHGNSAPAWCATGGEDQTLVKRKQYFKAFKHCWKVKKALDNETKHFYIKK